MGDSFAKLAPIAPAAAAMFYDQLFVLDPALRPLFKGDMAEHGRKLMSMIDTAVANLGKLDVIVPAVRELGRRHAGYGVRQAHYVTVGTRSCLDLRAGPRRGLHTGDTSGLGRSLYDPGRNHAAGSRHGMNVYPTSIVPAWSRTRSATQPGLDVLFVRRRGDPVLVELVTRDRVAARV